MNPHQLLIDFAGDHRVNVRCCQAMTGIVEFESGEGTVRITWIEFKCQHRLRGLVDVSNADRHGSRQIRQLQGQTPAELLGLIGRHRGSLEK